MKKIGILFCCMILCTGIRAQLQKYKICIIAFYNLENFYDTVNNPMVNDDDFTPAGDKHYNGKIYQDKIDKLASVISKIGIDHSPDGPALLGVAEIENDTVLNDLTHHPLLKHRHYSFVHFDSKDSRGVDVALLYQPRYFQPLSSDKLAVPIPGNNKKEYHTRDILYVKGLLDGEIIHVYVNHWPSRRGGEQRSVPARMAAASVCKHHIDRIQETKPEKIIVMGDLNDDPTSRSITSILQPKNSAALTMPGDLFNPWTMLFKKGIGTLANRDSWGLFDQILISGTWLTKVQAGFFYHDRFIFRQPFMIENTGRYKGYPMRTWDGNTYRGGYSDHFPTYIILLKSGE